MRDRYIDRQLDGETGTIYRLVHRHAARHRDRDVRQLHRQAA